MSDEMERNKRIVVIILILVAVALLATLLSIIVTGISLERQIRRRWGLTEAQMEKIANLVEEYRKGKITLEDLKKALWWRFKIWGVAPPTPLDILDIQLFYTVRAVISTVNIALVLILLFTYLDIYWKTRAEFTAGLVIFSLVLLFYTITSNPFIQRIFGFRAFGLGPFAMLPDLFAFMALLVLLYLSLK